MKIQKQVPLTEGPISKSLTGLAVPIDDLFLSRNTL